MIVTLMNFFVIFVPSWFYFGLYLAICQFFAYSGQITNRFGGIAFI